MEILTIDIYKDPDDIFFLHVEHFIYFVRGNLRAVYLHDVKINYAIKDQMTACSERASLFGSQTAKYASAVLPFKRQ